MSLSLNKNTISTILLLPKWAIIYNLFLLKYQRLLAHEDASIIPKSLMINEETVMCLAYWDQSSVCLSSLRELRWLWLICICFHVFTSMKLPSIRGNEKVCLATPSTLSFICPYMKNKCFCFVSIDGHFCV